MAVCYLDTQDRQAEQNFDKMTFLLILNIFQGIDPRPKFSQQKISKMFKK